MSILKVLESNGTIYLRWSEGAVRARLNQHTRIFTMALWCTAFGVAVPADTRA